jgi:hypothetical protein
LFFNFMQTNYPVGVQAPPVAGRAFLALCRGMRGAAIPPATFHNFLNVHPPLTNGDFARLLMDLGYRRFRDILDAALPGGLNVPVGATHTPAAMIAYAITREHADAVSLCLGAAITSAVPTDLLFRLLEHLRHIVAGDRVRRVRLFIEQAAVARDAKGRLHPWTEVETLFRNFTAAGRHNNDPAAVPAAVAVNAGRLRCTGERIRYFMRGHSCPYHDFNIAGRTRSDITLFPLGTTVADVRIAVAAAFAAVPAADIDTASGGGAAHIISPTATSSASSPRAPSTLP